MRRRNSWARPSGRRFSQRLSPAGAILLGAAAARADQMPPAITAQSALRVWPDQIGYRTQARKILIVASDRPPSVTLLRGIQPAPPSKTPRPCSSLARAAGPR
jgi:hypothetical protein